MRVVNARVEFFVFVQSLGHNWIFQIWSYSSNSSVNCKKKENKYDNEAKTTKAECYFVLEGVIKISSFTFLSNRKNLYSKS